jgi:7-carboxy-7-deazaguanine synthase
MIKVAERFYSVQGEGRFAGTPAYFVRLSGCNFMCSWEKPDGTRELCDTVAVWKNTKEERTPSDLANDIISELSGKVVASRAVHIVLTGGEPLLQRKEASELIKLLKAAGFFCELETNGSICDFDFYSLFDNISWSPKMSSATYGLQYYKKLKALDFWKENAGKLPVDMKIVIGNNYDFAELDEWLAYLKGSIAASRIYLMPLSNTRKEHEANSQILVEACMRRGLKYSPRLQLVLWDKVVGV